MKKLLPLLLLPLHAAGASSTVTVRYTIPSSQIIDAGVLVAESSPGQIATLGAARVMKKDQELGSIAPGKLADLILVDGDPSKHISDLRKVQTVIKDGTRYVVSELDQALSVRPAP